MGTPGGVINYDKMGNLPFNNWRTAQCTPIAEKTTGTTMKETIWVSRAGCKFCPIHCGRLVQNTEGPFALDGVQEGPGYEGGIPILMCRLCFLCSPNIMIFEAG